MNDKKFLQLLNLYIDGEATPAEAAEIELEIAGNPARRSHYQEYRRIQTATRAIYEQFRASAENAPARSAAGRRVAPAHAVGGYGRSFQQAGLWAGGAIAACLAVAVAFWSLPGSSRPASPAQVAEAPGVSVQTVTTIAAAVPASLPDATYAAPFSVQSGPDSYVRFGGQASDPFSLAPAGRQPDFGDPAVVLANAPAFDSARFAPATWPMDAERIAEQNRKLQAILRGRSDSSEPAQGGFVPVKLKLGP